MRYRFSHTTSNRSSVAECRIHPHAIAGARQRTALTRNRHENGRNSGKTLLRMLSWAALALCCVAVTVAQSAPRKVATDSAFARQADVTHALRSYASIPLSFEANQGQTDPMVQFVAHGPGYSLYLAPGEAYVSLEQKPDQQPDQQPADGRDVLRMKLSDARAQANVAGVEKQGGVVNYFVGNDPKKWHAGIVTYGKVKYSGIYPGIDLVFYGNQSQLDYDFVIAPHADAAQIAWQIDGAKLSVDREGNLQLDAANGPASFKKPAIYQADGDKRLPVQGHYVIAGNKVSFALGAYDHSKPLVIDPILSYLTYLGGKLNSGSGGQPAGTYLGYPEYGSGWGTTPTNSIAVDSEGSVYVTGYTDAYDFPVKDAYEKSPAYMMDDSRLNVGFVTKLNPEGTALVYSTYLSGNGENGAWTTPYAIAVDAEGSAYVTGATGDNSFPVTPGAFDRICGSYNNQGVQTENCGVDASQEAFVTKLSPDGETLEYSTFLGAGFADSGFSIAVDARGQAYVAGSSADGCYPSNANTPLFQCFQTTANAFQPGTTSCVIAAGDSPTSPPSCYGNYGFVTVLNSTGTGLLYSTLIGFNTGLVASGALSQYSYVGSTYANGVAVNSRGEFFVAGGTTSWYMPTTDGAFEKTIYVPQSPQARNAGGWVAKFEPVDAEAKIDYLTYLAPPASDKNDDSSVAGAIAADEEGNAYVVGDVSGQGFPSTKGAFQRSCGEAGFDECYSGFVSKLNPTGSKLLWSTYFGDSGPGNNQVNGVGMVRLDSAGNVYFAGSSFASVGFPEVNPVEPSGGNGEAFVAELNPTGSKLLFYSQVGSVAGLGTQDGQGLDVDAKGNIYLAGYTNSSGLATTKGAFQSKAPTGSGGIYGFVAKIAPVAPTTTSLQIVAKTGTSGEVLNLTATVKTHAYSPEPAGKVTFALGSTTLGTAELNSSGVATLVVKSPKAGRYTFKAAYAGNEFNLPSKTELIETLKDETRATLTSSTNPSTPGKAVTFTVTVTSPDGTPGGEVTLRKNGAIVATKALSKGTASFPVDFDLAGTHRMVADFLGDATFAASTSNAIAEVTKGSSLGPPGPPAAVQFITQPKSQ